MSYRFTQKLDRRICRICENSFDKSWSDGGIGAVCKICYNAREEMDLLTLGILRNIKRIKNPNRSNDIHTYEFEAKIDDVWYPCDQPNGDWSYIKSGNPDLFSVPVGWWELDELYRSSIRFTYHKNGEAYRKLLRHEKIEEGAMQSWGHGELQPIMNSDGETIGGTPSDFSKERDFYNPI